MPRQFGKVDVSATWACDKCRHRHAPGSRCPPADVWLSRGTPSGRPGVVWLKRPMPDGGWPPSFREPCDDSYSWWVRSSCGHQGGARQWAFYEEADADLCGQVFRDDPCRFTRCPQHIMIENDRGRR